MKRWIFSLIILLTVPTTLWSQIVESPLKVEEWIDTDRPDNTDSPNTLQKGKFQIESGILFRRDTENGMEQMEFLYPRMLMRFGLFEFLELRVAGDHRSEQLTPVDQKGETIRTRDINALTVGTKIRLYEGEGLIPSVGVVANVTLPFFSVFAPTKVAPLLRLALGHELSESISLQYNLGWERSWEEGVVQSQLVYTSVLQNEFSKRIIAFIEVFGEKALDGNFTHTVDGGFLYRVSPNLQVDIWAGKGLTSNASDFFVGTGFGYSISR